MHFACKTPIKYSKMLSESMKYLLLIISVVTFQYFMAPTQDFLPKILPVKFPFLTKNFLINGRLYSRLSYLFLHNHHNLPTLVSMLQCISNTTSTTQPRLINELRLNFLHPATSCSISHIDKRIQEISFTVYISRCGATNSPA